MFFRTSLILASLFSTAAACDLAFVDPITCTLEDPNNSQTTLDCFTAWPYDNTNCEAAGPLTLSFGVPIANGGAVQQQIDSINLSGAVSTGSTASPTINPGQTKTLTFDAVVDACAGPLSLQVTSSPPGNGRRLSNSLFCPPEPTTSTDPGFIGDICPECSTPVTDPPGTTTTPVSGTTTPASGTTTPASGTTTPASGTTASPGGTGEQGGGKRRRRLSAAANLVSPQDEVYQAHLDKCGEHEYDVSIYVDPAPHMYAILEPTSSECPHGATHSIHYADGSYNKELISFDNKADYQQMFDQEAFPIGTFTLAELEQAFQKVDVNSNQAYNVVENNCGMYLAKLGSELGVKVNHKMVSFVTRRLVEYSSKDLMDSIRKTAGSLFQGRGLRASVADKDVMELLVKDSAADVLA